jgi:hypothetical protein
MPKCKKLLKAELTIEKSAILAQKEIWPIICKTIGN